VRHPTWSRDLGELVAGENPWLSQVFDAGEVWLARVIAGQAGSAFVPLGAASGAGPPEPVVPTLPEDLFCGAQLWHGLLMCAWDQGIYAIDPATGLPGPEPWASQPGVQWLGLDATGDLLIAVGMRGFDPLVAAFSPGGTERWSRPVVIDGCYVENPEYQVEIRQVDGEARIALAAYQFAVSLADGQVLVEACGMAAFTPDGAMVVGQIYGDEPAPPGRYTGAAGTERLVMDAGMALQVVAFAAGGREFWAVIDDAEHLRLYHAETGQLAWELDWQYGRVQTWDQANLYASSRQGLRAVALDTGDIAWTWAGEAGMAVRTAVLTRDGGLVVATSSGVSGLDPATGAELWAIKDPALAGWYWSPSGADPEAAKAGNVVGYIGVEHTAFARVDAPAIS
jgi:outer membrane protein assembly factor BamB